MKNHKIPFGDPEENEKLADRKFNELKVFLANYDSIKLISHLSLTYLFYPGGEFKPDYDDIHKWALWIEFIVGLITRNDQVKNNTFIHGPVLEELEKLLKEYFDAVNKYIMSIAFEGDASKKNRILFHLKINALHVRGDSYPHKLLDLSLSLYTHLSTMFHQKYGFSIDDAIELCSFIKKEYEIRVNTYIVNARKLAPIVTEKQIEKYPELEKDRSKLEISNFCEAFFGKSDVILSFTENDIVKGSKITREICSRLLGRLSQNFRYSNPNHPSTFVDALKSPFDFNTLYEKPILKYGKKYFVPIPSLFETVLLNTFHYDFISDNKYKSNYDELKGHWLEKRTTKAFSHVFGEQNVIMNPYYPNGEELCDVLVLFDRKIFIIQCKSKSLTYLSKIGIDFEAIKSDLDKGIKSPYEQGLRARTYLLENEFPAIIQEYIKTTIDTKQVSDVFLFSVTLGYYQALVTHQSSFDTLLNYFKENIYPWSLSIADLELITDIINNPYEFVHYTKRRLKMESITYEISADEMDLLNFYLKQNMNWEDKDFKNNSMVSLTGFSTDVDKYFYEKYELKIDVEKPTRQFIKGFKDFIKQVEVLDVAYKTDCIDKLLMLKKSEQKNFLDSIEKLKKQEFKKEKIKAINLVNPNYDFGITYFLMDSHRNTENLYRQVFPYSVLRKYEHKKLSWVSFGKDINSDKIIDSSVFIAYEWVKDLEIEKMLNKS